MDDGSECPWLIRCMYSCCSCSYFKYIESFCQLFGASSFTKEYVLHIPPNQKSTVLQNFLASIAGAVASITVAAPLDVVKTRIQNANFENKVSGMAVVRELVRDEGVGALFKGLTPKVRILSSRQSEKIFTLFFYKILVVGPKLVFSYTMAQTLIPLFANYV